MVMPSTTGHLRNPRAAATINEGMVDEAWAFHSKKKTKKKKGLSNFGTWGFVEDEAQ